MQIKTKIVGCHTDDSKPVKQEVISTVILPPLVFPGFGLSMHLCVGRIGNIEPGNLAGRDTAPESLAHRVSRYHSDGEIGKPEENVI